MLSVISHHVCVRACAALYFSFLDKHNQPLNRPKDLSGNRVASLEGVQELASLEELWMGYNRVGVDFMYTLYILTYIFI